MRSKINSHNKHYSKQIFDVISMTLMAIFTLCDLYEIFAIKMCMTSILTLSGSRSNIKNANQKIKHDFLFDSYNNVCPICHHLQDIHNPSAHQHDLQIGPRSNVNMSIESQGMSFYMVAIVICALSVIICELFTVKMCITLIFRIYCCQMYICQLKPHT